MLKEIRTRLRILTERALSQRAAGPTAGHRLVYCIRTCCGLGQAAVRGAPSTAAARRTNTPKRCSALRLIW